MRLARDAADRLRRLPVALDRHHQAMLAQCHAALAPAHRLCQRILDLLPPGTGADLRAYWFTSLGLWASEAGHPAEEAVAIRRELAAGNPDRYRPDLARSLRVLADSLSLLGRSDEASAAWSEADALTSGPAE